jgi:hypothetical protein
MESRIAPTGDGGIADTAPSHGVLDVSKRYHEDARRRSGFMAASLSTTLA